MRATRWYGENDVGHILIKEGVYGCYGNCEANRARGQPARQAGRILIHPTWIQVNPWTKLPFPHNHFGLSVSIALVPPRFFFLHNQTATAPLPFPLLLHLLPRASCVRKCVTDRGAFHYYGYDSSGLFDKPPPPSSSSSSSSKAVHYITRALSLQQESLYRIIKHLIDLSRFHSHLLTNRCGLLHNDGWLVIAYFDSDIEPHWLFPFFKTCSFQEFATFCALWWDSFKKNYFLKISFFSFFGEISFI